MIPQPESIVGIKGTDKIGVVIPHQWFNDGIPVVSEGSELFFEYHPDDLNIIGKYQPEISDPTDCGLGQGINTCKWLGAVVGGFECQRFGQSRYGIIFNDKNLMAQASPTAHYPYCQDEIRRVYDLDPN